MAAFLFDLRHKSDEAYMGEVDVRLRDPNSANWLSIDDFEAALDEKGAV